MGRFVRRTRVLTLLVIVACLTCLAGTAVRARSPAEQGSAAPAGPATPAGLTRTEILADERVRVQSIVLEPGATIPTHTHAQAHLTAALGSAELLEVAGDGTERRRSVADGALALSPAGATHSLRNDGASAFRAVAIDLLAPQTGAHNRCAALLPGQALDCAGKDASASSKKKGGSLVPQWETDQTLVSLLTLDSGGEHLFKASERPPVVVALAWTDARAVIELKIPGAVGKGEKPLKGGDAVTTVPKSPLTIRNTGAGPARLVVVEFRR